MKKGGVSIKYYIPLRAHTANIEISYKKDQEAKIALSLYGLNVASRWNYVDELAQAFNKKFQPITVSTVVAMEGIKVTWNVPQITEDDVTKIMNTVRQALTLSFVCLSSHYDSEVQAIIDTVGSARMPDFRPAVKDS